MTPVLRAPFAGLCWLAMLGVAVAQPAPDRTTTAAEARTPEPYLRSVSPITPSVAANLREIASRNGRMRDDVFSKVGDSATVNWGFMSCFGMEDGVTLDGRDWLWPTIRAFRGGGRVFRRESEAARVGWSSYSPLQGGSNAALFRELRSVFPRFALVMFGTNDLEGNRIDRYAAYMWSIVDHLTERGVVPILSTILPRGDSAQRDSLVPFYNAVVRALATANRLPYVDLHAELLPLPGLGLAGDGVHPNTYRDGSRPLACDLTAAGLRYGTNTRNLLNILQLDRVRRVLVDGAPAPDPEPPPPEGDLSRASPLRVELPFGVIGDASTSERRDMRFHEHCAGAPEQPGPEHVYQVRVDAPTRVWIQLFGRDQDAPLVVSVLDADRRCVAFDRDVLDVTLAPGIHHVAVDAMAEGAGRFLLVAEPIPPPGTTPARPRRRRR